MNHNLELLATNTLPAKFGVQNRRFLGNKFKLLHFIEECLRKNVPNFKVFCDIFAGTGVVGAKFNSKSVKVISNDFLISNYLPIKAFLGTTELDFNRLFAKLELLNSLRPRRTNYFSEHFGNTYFTLENARKIGSIREKIDEIAESEEERIVLITSLLYAVDKVANTVGHYDAYRECLDSVKPIRLLAPNINLEKNRNNQIYQMDANKLVREITCDILYIDPPYNSRQYSDTYHVLENLAAWQKPPVFGKAKKMERSHLKSKYCLKSALSAFVDLINNADCRHILVSYNNTGESKHSRSNARISYKEIANTLKKRGTVEVFEQDYKAFTTGRSDTNDHMERLFYCRVTK